MSTNENESRSALIEELERPKVKPVGYIALILGIVFFSGIMQNTPTWIRWFDYGNIMGKFGALSDTAKSVQGSGGIGAREGFMYAMTVWPSTLTAIAFINVIEGLDGLKAGQRLLNRVLRPFLGIPGWSSLALVSGLTASTDAGAALTLDLVENDLITSKELGIFSCFNFVASGFVGSVLTLLGSWSPFTGAVGIPVWLILVSGIAAKAIAGNIMRLYIKIFDKEKPQAA